jgi:hypothetical protein
MVTVRFSDGAIARTLTGDDFALDIGRADSREFETRTGGSLDIQIEVDTESAGRVTSGTLTLPLQPDWIWNVSFYFGVRNPNDGCIGCFGYRSFTVMEAYRTSEAESLWMIWGGNSISSPVVY